MRTSTDPFDLGVDHRFPALEGRKLDDLPEREDPDDEELSETPADVVELLGFDPLDLEADDDDNAPQGGPGVGAAGEP